MYGLSLLKSMALKIIMKLCYKTDFLLLGIEVSQGTTSLSNCLILLMSYEISYEITVIVDLNDTFLSKLQLQFQQRCSNLSCRKL